MPDVSLSLSAASTQVVPNGGKGRGEKGLSGGERCDIIRDI